MIIPKARQLPSGSWHIQIRIDGKSYSGTFDTKEAVEAWALSIKSSMTKKVKATDYYRLLRCTVDDLPQEKGSESNIPTIAAELEAIDNMSGIEFEKYCAALFAFSGCFPGGKIRITQASCDYGADIIITCMDGAIITVQCKRQKTNVRIGSIQEVVGSKKHYKAQAAAVITNAKFTEAARELAKDNGVALFDRKTMIKLINIKIEAMKKNAESNQWETLLERVGILPESKKTRKK